MEVAERYRRAPLCIGAGSVSSTESRRRSVRSLKFYFNTFSNYINVGTKFPCYEIKAFLLRLNTTCLLNFGLLSKGNYCY